MIFFSTSKLLREAMAPEVQPFPEFHCVMVSRKPRNERRPSLRKIPEQSKHPKHPQELEAYAAIEDFRGFVDHRFKFQPPVICV